MPAKFRMRVKPSPDTDTQQYELYRMEEECLNGTSRAKMTQAQMNTFARAVARKYGISTPRIELKDLGKWSGMCWASGRIALNPKKRKACGILTVAHELAHHVHNRLAPHITDEHQAHGPEFMCCYMSLLDAFRILPLTASRALFKSYRLKFIDPGDDLDVTRLRKLISKG